MLVVLGGGLFMSVVSIHSCWMPRLRDKGSWNFCNGFPSYFYARQNQEVCSFSNAIAYGPWDFSVTFIVLRKILRDFEDVYDWDDIRI